MVNFEDIINSKRYKIITGNISVGRGVRGEKGEKGDPPDITPFREDYESLKKVIIDENASANLQNQINSFNSHLDKMTYLAKEYGITNDENTSSKIQELIDKIPSGSKIQFENIVYTLTTNIDFKGKDIEIITLPQTEFIGIGKFPQFITNSFHRKDGYFLSRKPSIGKTEHPTINYGNYGDSTLSLEMLPQEGYKGNSVGLFVSTRSENSVENHECWGANICTTTSKNYRGNAWGLEIDASCWSEGTNMIGCDAVCPSKYMGYVGYRATGVSGMSSAETYDDYRWKYGFVAEKAQTGLSITESNRGIYIENAITEGIAIKNKSGHIRLKGTEDTADNDIFLNITDVNDVQKFLVKQNGGVTCGELRLNSFLQYPSNITQKTRTEKRIYKKYTHSGTVTVNANDTFSFTLQFEGVEIGDNLFISSNFSLPSGIIIVGFVSATNTVTIMVNNCKTSQLSFDGMVLGLVSEKISLL